MWTTDAFYDRSAFNPLRRDFALFSDSLEDVVLRKKEKGDTQSPICW
jgi:hypothetical protein